MIQRTILISILVILIFVGCKKQPQLTTSSLDQKVDSVLSLMTLEEKVGQTVMYSGTWEFTGPVPTDGNNAYRAKQISSGLVGGMLNVLTAEGTREAQRLAVENSRLGIPLIFGYDVIHGYQTMFPVPLAQAASWDPEVARLGAEVAALEAASSGVHWTFAPMIDVCRDARFGRIMESAGEDPYLTSVMTKSWIEGYQGNDLSDELTIAACAKHFAAYGFVESGRDYNTVDISKNTLYNVVLPPFKVASEADVATFMNAFNDLNGIPATGNVHLQRDLLKGVWGFDGFVVSDWGSIGEMLNHRYASDSADAAIKAMTAGSDMDMESEVYETQLSGLVKNGRIDEQLLDDAVRRILKVKFQLGLFDDPYKYCSEDREKENLLTEANLESSRDAARKSIVLLKNEEKLLPIQPDVKSIAVIGDLADDKDNPLGNWRAQAIDHSAVSVLEGIRERAGSDTKVEFAQGYLLTEGDRSFGNELTFADDDQSGFQKAREVASRSDLVILVMGEDCYQSGEGRSQTDITLKGKQVELVAELSEVNDQIVVVLMTGRPVAIPGVAKVVPSIIEAWHGGSQAGHAIADVLFGDYNPSGKLPASFPYTTGQEPLHYDRKNTGRPVPESGNYNEVFWSHFTDSPNEALFPFGFGLSYTSFQYENLRVTAENGQVLVSVDLKNMGNLKGKETVQLYIGDMAASITQPIKRLVAFQQIELKPGQQETMNFVLAKRELGFYDEDYQFVAEDGVFEIMVGGDSREVLRTTIDVIF